VSLSLILCRNKKVKHYIRNKTHKFIILRFLVESDVNSLCRLDLIIIVVEYPW